MDQQKIGAFLKQLRKEKEMTQEQLAEHFTVSARTVSRWETGSNMPDISLLIELAEFYDVDIREILNGERKSENMNQEVKETAQMVADYADGEKEKVLKRVRNVCIAGLVSMFIGLMMEGLQPDSGIPVYEVLKGMTLGLAMGALVTATMFTTGALMKIKAKTRQIKAMRWVPVICFAFAAFCLIMAVIESL